MKTLGIIVAVALGILLITFITTVVLIIRNLC